MKKEERVRVEKEHVDQIEEAYNRGARQYQKKWKVPHPWMEEERTQFAQLLHPGSRILDVGCGPGQDCAYFSSLGMRTLGIDRSSEMISIAIETYLSLAFQQLDLFDVVRLPEKFDAIWASYVLLHIKPSRLSTLIEVFHTTLVNDGYLFVATPVSEKTEERWTPIAGLLDTSGDPIQAPIVVWALSELKEILSQKFTIHWERVVPFTVEGKPPICNIILKRR